MNKKLLGLALLAIFAQASLNANEEPMNGGETYTSDSSCCTKRCRTRCCPTKARRCCPQRKSCCVKPKRRCCPQRRACCPKRRCCNTCGSRRGGYVVVNEKPAAAQAAEAKQPMVAEESVIVEEEMPA